MPRVRLPAIVFRLFLLLVLCLPVSWAQAQGGSQNHEIKVGTSKLKVLFSTPVGDEARQTILDWTRRSARAVTVYYGQFPVPSVRIRIDPFPGRGVRGGRAYGGAQPVITIAAGTSSTPYDFAQDWRMVHEIIHLAFPMLDQRHNWMTEGLAVYVESVARLQAKDLDEATVWKGFVDGMEKGVPGAGDRGLDHTPTWGRTYWGGAIFCLVADLEIRAQTKGKKTLQDALRGVLASGGNHRSHWPLVKALKAGDATTGTNVLMDLYEAWRATPVDPKLAELWKRLGIEDNGRTVSFDDTADLASVRREIGKPAVH